MQAEHLSQGGGRTIVEFARIKLCFAPGNEWRDAVWRFDEAIYAASLIEGIASVEGRFPTEVIMERGNPPGNARPVDHL